MSQWVVLPLSPLTFSLWISVLYANTNVCRVELRWNWLKKRKKEKRARSLMGFPRTLRYTTLFQFKRIVRCCHGNGCVVSLKSDISYKTFLFSLYEEIQLNIYFLLSKCSTSHISTMEIGNICWWKSSRHVIKQQMQIVINRRKFTIEHIKMLKEIKPPYNSQNNGYPTCFVYLTAWWQKD